MRLTRICLESLTDRTPKASLAAEKAKKLHQKSFDLRDISNILGSYTSLSNKSTIALTRKYDSFYWQGAYKRFKTRLFSKEQYFNTEKQTNLGADMYASQFVLSKGGRIRLSTNRDSWIKYTWNLPSTDSKVNLIGVDATKCEISPSGLENFYDLKHLEYLNLSKNHYLDDLSCDFLSRQFRNSKSLQFIDLTDNPMITINGLETLFRIRSLKVIKCTLSEHLELFKMLAKDECNCDIVTN